MNKKKMMLIPILALLLLSVPAAMAVDVYVEGEGTYSQTTKIGDLSDSVTLTGKWIFDSYWEDGSEPYINNHVTLETGATYYEHAVSPRGNYYGEGYISDHSADEDANPGLDLLTVVTYPTSNIQDIADIKVRGYDFTFSAEAGSYTSTKKLIILDSYNNLADKPDSLIIDMDNAMFQVIDTTDSVYMVGGAIEYEERSFNTWLTSLTKVYLQQTFTQGSDTSHITVWGSTPDWVRSTAFFGAGSGSILDPLDWYAEVVTDAHATDVLKARFIDDTAHIYLYYGKPQNYATLDAYSSTGDFNAQGNADGIGDRGTVDLHPGWGTWVPPTDQWTFTGSSLFRVDDPSGDGIDYNWLVELDMDPTT